MNRLTTVDSLPMLDRQNYYQTQHRLLRKTARPAEALVALEKYDAAVLEFDRGEKNRQLINYHERVRQLTHEKLMADRQHALDRKNSLIVALSIGCLLLAVAAALLVLYWPKRKMLKSKKLTRLELATE